MGANGRWPKGKAIGLMVGTVLKMDKKGQDCAFINQGIIITFALAKYPAHKKRSLIFITCLFVRLAASWES